METQRNLTGARAPQGVTRIVQAFVSSANISPKFAPRGSPAAPVLPVSRRLIAGRPTVRRRDQRRPQCPSVADSSAHPAAAVSPQFLRARAGKFAISSGRRCSLGAVTGQVTRGGYLSTPTVNQEVGVSNPPAPVPSLVCVYACGTFRFREARRSFAVVSHDVPPSFRSRSFAGDSITASTPASSAWW